MNKKLNIAFSISRIFAILSVVSAHIMFETPVVLSKVFLTVGSIGVIVFMILSGYYYRTEKYIGICNMLKDKARSIGVPWLVMGTVSYLVFAIVNKDLSIGGWVLYMLGKDSMMYYLTMLSLCYIIFFKQSKPLLLAAVGVTVVSVYASAFGCLDDVIYPLHMTHFLNIFNWVGYFALGCLLRGLKPERIYVFLQKSVFITLPLFLAAIALIVAFDIKTGYFSYVGMPFQLLGALTIAGVSTFKFLDCKPLHSLSNMTFGIYLIHTVILALINDFYEINAVLLALSPIISVLIAAGILLGGYGLSKLLHIEKIYMCATGVRMNRNIKA